MTVWRISIVYILSLLFVGLLVPYDDERLVGGSYGETNYCAVHASASFLILANARRQHLAFRHRL
jgi:amino acid permease